MDHGLGRRDHSEGAGGAVPEEALEELYLAHSSKWHQVVIEARKKLRILPNDMDQSRRDTIHEWSTAEDTIGPIPDLNNEEILKDISRCFTSKDNSAGTSKSNVQFQRDLSTMIRADNEYHSNPTLGRLCGMIAGIMHTWERLTAETNRMGGHVQYHQQVEDLKASGRHGNSCDECWRGDRWQLRGLQQTEPLTGILQTSIPSGLQ